MRLLDELRSGDKRHRETLVHVPLDVAMEDPYTWVVSSESDCGPSFTGDHDGVSSSRVSLTFHDDVGGGVVH